MKSILAALLIALLALCGGRALAQGNLSGYQKAVTYLDDDNERHVWVFTETLDGRMVSKHFDGTSWVWMNHGKPPGSTLVANSQPVTYRDANGNHRIYVFAVDNNGELVVRFYKGPLYGWQWSKQGAPKLLGATISAITFVDDSGNHRLQAFGVTRVGGNWKPYRMMVNEWDGSSWSWTELPSTVGATHIGDDSFTAATHFVDQSGDRRVQLFTRGGWELVRFSWANNNWYGGPLGIKVFAPAAAVNHLDDSGTGNRHAHALVGDRESNNIWDFGGSSELALYHPTGVGDAPLQGLSVINYTESGGGERLDLFASYHGSNVLFRRSSLNDIWYQWYQIALPPGSPQAVHNPNAITYLDTRGGLQHKYVFMLGPAYHLWAYFWNGLSWQWVDLGTPP